MRQLKGKIWVKTVLLFFTVITGMAALCTAILTIMIGTTAVSDRTQEAIEQELYYNIYTTYAAAMMTEYFSGDMNPEALTALEDGNIRYSVVRYEETYDTDEEGNLIYDEEKNKTEVLYTNDARIDESNHEVLYSNVWGVSCSGNADSFWNAIRGCSYRTEYNYLEEEYTDDTMVEHRGTIKRYCVYLSPAESLWEEQTLRNGMTDYSFEASQLAGKIYQFTQTCGWWLLISVLLFGIGLFGLLRAAGHRPESDEIVLRWFDRIPFAVYSGAMFVVWLFVVASAFWIMDELFWSRDISLVFGIVSVSLLVAGMILVLLFYLMSIAVRIKTKTFWKSTLLYYIARPVGRLFQMCRSNVPLFAKALLLFAAVGFAQLIFLAATMYDARMMIAGFLVFKMVETGILIHVLYQMKLLKDGGRRIAAGDYSHPIDTHRMLWEFRQHANHINRVGDGISVAVAERMKSEHFKTELITNVSHDIKTPLTSIINYVDLMKKEEIENPTMLEYVEVLDRQSSRLKKLIEDLMEASKASTGNLPVNLEVCDATVMLSQIVGEFEERAKANGLELVTEYPEPPVEIMADGRHLWRVIDNLMSNVCKYAMQGTRVYINLEIFHGMVIFTFRNISRSRLNLGSEELMERFVRGDSSRNTEGSGLGLSIAQSLTTLMGGNMAIQTDGDLFKAIVSFPQVER